MDTPKTIFLTGGAGYVGKLLVSFLAEKRWVEQIIIIDKQPEPELLSEFSENILYIQKNLVDDWENQVADLQPDIIIHAAWEIREPYFNKGTYKRENVQGSKNVFEFAFSTESVEKLVHFSTVASYGAEKENSITNRFQESDELRKSGYSYSDQKRIVEMMLQDMHQDVSNAENTLNTVVLRPASITGPFGRNIEDGFGLQSALSGDLADSDSVWFRLIDKLLFFTPITPQWVRQFVHEDDVVNIIAEILQQDLQSNYEVFNLAPPGEVMRGEDMARAVDKTPIEISPQLIRFVFFVVWHVSVGKIPTAPGVWKTYSYPITVDGSKVTDQLGYEYSYDTFEAFLDESGRFAQLE
jgi:nucleoside-diphosphate-sugar epimerase